MAVLLLVICIPLAFWLARLREVPAIVAWIVPVGLGIFWYLEWRHEANWTGGGDPQPGLIALVGKVSVGLVFFAMIIGFGVRYRSPRTNGRGRREP
jgi:hypothetical protein